MEAELNEQLVADLDQGFEAMVRTYGQRLFAFAYAMSGNAADAEEVAQDAFVRAHRALRRYEPERVRELHVNAWLHRIALNVVRNRHRRRLPRVVPLDGELEIADDGPGPERQALSRAELRELADEDLVQRLREAKAELFNLRVQGATGQLDNNRRLQVVRKDIARIYTIMRERELGLSAAPEEVVEA